MKIDRVLRRYFPSVSMLTYKPFFKFVVDGVDHPFAFAFPETRTLPPNHMRLRVGVGNKVFNNQFKHIVEPIHFWMDAALNDYITSHSTILDIGVGCGRYAQFINDFKFCDLSFTGQYIGIDIDEEMLNWCRKSYDDRFRFHLSSDPSKSYNRESGATEFFKIPEPDNSVDFVFSRSLFTHLLEREARNYMAESCRLLKPGGWASHSIFCLDHPPPTMGDRHTFSHKMGNAHVESLAQPEAAVAYTSDFMIALAKEVGFAEAKMRYEGPTGWQPVLVARKGT